MPIATIVFALLCGYLIDRFGALRLLPFFLPAGRCVSWSCAENLCMGIYAFLLLLGIRNGFTFTLIGGLWPGVYGLANLGGIRATTVAAMVLATAVGPGVTGALIDAGIALTTQMHWLAGWCLIASFLLAFAARKVHGREAQSPD
jgi:hypothetical protein